MHKTFPRLQWRHIECDGVSNHQPHDCLLNRLFRLRPKKTSKLCVTGLCAGNSPVTGEFPAQRASNAENVSIWWRHHVSWYRHGSFHSLFISSYSNTYLCAERVAMVTGPFSSAVSRPHHPRFRTNILGTVCSCDWTWINRHRELFMNKVTIIVIVITPTSDQWKISTDVVVDGTQQLVVTGTVTSSNQVVFMAAGTKYKAKS